MNFTERAAKQILEALVAGAKVIARHPDSRLTHDFDLQYPDGKIVPVEVTSSVDVVKAETYQAISKHGALVQRKKCQQDWLVHPLPGANIKRIREQIDHYLARVETDGLRYFHTFYHSFEFESVGLLKRDLAIESGGIVKWKRPGIQIGLPGGGGAVDASCAVTAIDAELQRIDNRTKLAATGAPERHLFVYIDAINFLPWVGLRDFDPSGYSPSLPEEITDVWAAAGAGKPTQYTVWRGNANGWTPAGSVLLDEEADYFRDDLVLHHFKK